MKKLTFKKGIYVIHIPFMLHDLSPWQEQIAEKIKKCKERYKVRKSAWWGFEIRENGAEIKCYKN